MSFEWFNKKKFLEFLKKAVKVLIKDWREALIFKWLN